ncbi:MAG: FtsX-like permease family protein [Candidatus Zixiibacteriota bacterium]|nr:MAG: FtsX-like permease family protein [candidate division Zixibacteria bacterium]
MIFENLKLAVAALWAHKLRTVLTVVGVGIGVSSVIAIISTLDGMMLRITSIFDEMGASTVAVTRFGMITSHDEWVKAMRRKQITVEDARAIETSCTLAEATGLAIEGHVRNIKRGNKPLYAISIVGYSASVSRIYNLDIAEGRFFTEMDDEHRRKVAVIGQEVKDKLFPYEDPLNKEIIVGGEKFTIIGIGAKKGSVMGENLDRYVYLPAQTMLKMTGMHQDISILVKMRSEMMMDQGMDQIRAVLRARRHVQYIEPDDFALITKEAVMGFVDSFTGTARLVTVAIPFISIIVAGIVVMNIMMVSVTERTREIGIRKAVGARSRHVLGQFLLEALMMCLIGGILGLAGGLGMASIASSKMGLPFVVSVAAVVVGCSIPTIIGLVFGIYPAWKAAKLDPIEALRFES